MSSSSNYHSSQVHHLNLHANGKRPFEECGGYDSDPNSSMNNSLQASGSSTSSGNSHRCPTSSSSSTSNGEGRNKRARSTSSSDTDVSTSTASTGYNTAQSSSHSDISFHGPSALPANVLDCPVPPVSSTPPFVPTQDIQMGDVHLDARRSSSPQRNRIPTPAMAEENLRSSLERFAEFDRQIAALRSSLAATRSPLPPPVASSGGEGQPTSHDDWSAMSSSFLSLGSSELHPSDTVGADSSNVAMAPNETVDSVSSFGSSDGSASMTAGPSPSGTLSGSFSPTYSNISRYPPYPSYRPSVGGNSSAITISSDSALPSFMRSSSSDDSTQTRFDTRSSISDESLGSDSSSPPLPQLEPIPEGSSSLGLNPETFSPTPSSPSSNSDEHVSRHRLRLDELANLSRQRSTGSSDELVLRHRQVLDELANLSRRRSTGSQDGDQVAEQAGPSSQTRLNARVRVVRNPGHLDRDPVRSVFDVFGIVPVPFPQRPFETPSESQRDYAPINNNPATTTITQGPPDFHSRLYSTPAWSSIPSSNSLMSESASERRHALALERYRTPRRRSSENDDDDEADARWLASLRGEGEPLERQGPNQESVPRPHVPGPVQSAQPPTASDPQRTHGLEPFSELFEETERVAREWAARDRVRGASVGPCEGAGTGNGSGHGKGRGEGEATRGGPKHDSGIEFWSRLNRRGKRGVSSSSCAFVCTTAATELRDQHDDGSNANDKRQSIFSGLFRDSLRRNVEVNHPSSGDGNGSAGAGVGAGAQTHAQSATGPVIPGRVVESRAASRLDADDSGSETDLEVWEDDLRSFRDKPSVAKLTKCKTLYGSGMLLGVADLTCFAFSTAQTQPRSRQPPLNLSLRPGFTVLRRGSENLDADGRPQYASRNTSMPNRSTPVPVPVPSVHTFSTSPQNGHNGRAADRERDRDRFLPARLLESLYGPAGDARRNSLTADWNQGERIDPNGRGTGDRNGGPDTESRRTSLGFGGSIRSRWARLANPQSSNAAGAARDGSSSSARQRSPPHPLGARPQTVDHRRAASASVANTSEPDSSRVFGHPPQWVVNSTAVEGRQQRRLVGRRRGARYLVPGVPSPTSAPTTPPTRGADVQLDLNRAEERISSSFTQTEVPVRSGMSDEQFDDSYEALLTLSNALGEVRSRATPEEYEPSDIVAKLMECPHWLHKGCLEQWLRTANTCPVCRKKVKVTSPKPGRRYCPHYRDPAVTATNNEGKLTYNGPWPSVMPGDHPSQPPRPVIGRRDATTRDTEDQPYHGTFIDRTRAHHHHVHVHAPHHPHYHRPSQPVQPRQPSPSRPTTGPSSTDAHSLHQFGSMSSFLGRRALDSSMDVDQPMHDGRPTARRPAVQQLIVPRAPPSEQDPRNEPRSSTAVPPVYFDMQPGRGPSVRRHEASGPTGGPSFTLAPSSSVTFTGAPAPPTPPFPTGRSSSPRPVVITNATESPVVVTSRTSQTFNTLFNLEPASSSLAHHSASQRRPSLGSSSQAPSELETNPWEDVAFGRAVRMARYPGGTGPAPGPSGPVDSADPTSGSSGSTHPWWST
ncbi:hypothetical protein BU15DRAFT_64806 [Melanogaster broomeanus]|nr:hypothetical protein BU15DRAFT_64806 [Melanogaster broomeanus]